MKNTRRILVVGLAAVLLPCGAGAAGRPSQPPGGRRPPQAAFDACKGKSEGAAVEISTPRGTLKAICRSIGDELVAVPEGAPPPSGGGRQSQ